MSPPLVLLAHAPGAEERAAEIAVQLAALGYAVDALPEAPRARNARLNAAHRLIILWSRDAANSPALRATARLARAAGKLACVRLDGAKPPPGICSKVSVRLPRGRAGSRAWRRILSDGRRGARFSTSAASGARNTTSIVRSNRAGGVAAALVMALAVSSAFYLVDADFAAHINAWAESAHARAGEIVDRFKTQTQRDG